MSGLDLKSLLKSGELLKKIDENLQNLNNLITLLPILTTAVNQLNQTLLIGIETLLTIEKNKPVIKPKVKKYTTNGKI